MTDEEITKIKKENSLLKRKLIKESNKNSNSPEFNDIQLEKINKIKEDSNKNTLIKFKLFCFSFMFFISLTINITYLSISTLLNYDLYKAIILAIVVELAILSCVFIKKDFFRNDIIKADISLLDKIKYLSISVVAVFSIQYLLTYLEISYFYLMVVVLFFVYTSHEIYKMAVLKVLNSFYNIETILIDSIPFYKRTAEYYKTYSEIRNENIVKEKIMKGNKKELGRLTRKNIKELKAKEKESVSV